MLKKLLLISSALTCSIAFANQCPAPYVGAGTGVTVNTSSGNIGNYRGLPGNLFIGYGGAVNAFYLAAELGVTVGTADITSNGSAKTSYGYNLSALPGVLMSESTVGFARVGLNRMEFANLNTMKTGFLLGLGLQTGIMQNIDLRAEYDYTSFPSITRGATTGTPRTDEVNFALIYKFN